MLRWTKEGIGEGIVDVVLSLDAQTKKLHGQEVATASYSQVRPTLETFEAIGDRLAEVEREIRDLEGHPGRYLRAMTNAFGYYARSLQGDALAYPELIRNVQELEVGLIPEEKAFRLREDVERGLGALGYKGTAQEKIAAWLEETRIAPEQVTAVAERFLARSKEETLQRVIGLPEEDGIDVVQAVRGVFWSGYSKYQGSYRGKLSFNIDRPWSEPVLAQIMTHEAYPGHQAFYCRWDSLFQRGELPLEASYYFINSPTNALFEGGPETALHFLGWDEENPAYKVARDYLDMQRVATTNACYLVNTGQATREEAVTYMARVGLVDEGQAQRACDFFTDAVQKMYYPAYYYGRWMVGKAYDLVAEEQRQEYFKILYDTPHTTNTFVEAIARLTGKEFDPFSE
jgi:hypothetical protein